MINKILFTLLFFFIITYIFAQDSIQKAQKIAFDSTYHEYVDALHHQLRVRLDINSDINDYDWQNPSPLQDFELVPNNTINTRITVGYKWLTIGHTFAMNINNFDYKKKEGESKVMRLDLNINLKSYQPHLFFRYNKGYLMENPGDFMPTSAMLTDDGRYILLNDFKSTLIGWENVYYFNAKKYAPQFAKLQTRVQKKSAGSLFTNLNLYYSYINGKNQDFSFINSPASYPNQNTSYYGIIGAGYAYNWMITKHFYATALAYPAIGFQKSILKYADNRQEVKTNSTLFLGVGEFSVGYTSKHWYAGVYSDFRLFSNDTNNNHLTDKQAYYMAFVGYRFKAPKFIQKLFGDRQ